VFITQIKSQYFIDRGTWVDINWYYNSHTERRKKEIDFRTMVVSPGHNGTALTITQIFIGKPLPEQPTRSSPQWIHFNFQQTFTNSPVQLIIQFI